jgi:hypothetical protein
VYQDLAPFGRLVAEDETAHDHLQHGSYTTLRKQNDLSAATTVATPTTRLASRSAELRAFSLGSFHHLL